MKKTTLLSLSFLLAVLCAEAGDYRWGGSNKDNRIVPENGTGTWMAPGRGRCYLYKGEMPVVEDYQVCMTGLTYVTDWNCGTSTSYGYFGNYTGSGKSILSSDLVSSAGKEKFCIICVSNPYTDKATPIGPIEIGTRAYVAILPMTSVGKNQTTSNPYAEITYTSKILDTDYYWNNKLKKVKFVNEIIPITDGGYMWGTTINKSNYYVKDLYGANQSLSASNAKIYLYLGKAVKKSDNSIDLGRMIFLTSGLAGSSGFGNYSKSIEQDQLIQDDRVDFKGGQDFTLFYVSKGWDYETTADMPTSITNKLKSWYTAYQTLVSEATETADGVKCAQLVSKTGTSGADNIKSLMFYDQIDYPPESALATLVVPKSYIVSYLGAEKTDEQLMEGSTNKYPTADAPYSLMEGYVLGVDPEDPDPAKQPTVLPVQGSSGDTLQLNVGNVTVNEKANADVKYGLISSSSPAFTDPTVEVDPQESPTLEATLPASGVKYYRAELTVQGK